MLLVISDKFILHTIKYERIDIELKLIILKNILDINKNMFDIYRSVCGF